MKLKIMKMDFWLSDEARVLIFGLTIIILFYIVSVLLPVITHSGIGFSESWNRWDAPHYLSIAQNGYQATGDESNFIVFYPLFPFATYLVSLILKNIFVSSLVVSNIFYLLSILYFYKLVKIDYDEQTAFKAVVLLSIFPTAYFFHAPYTESIFLFVSLFSVFCARRGNWLLASIFGILSCLGRVTGLILPVVLLVEFLSQTERPKKYFNIFYLLLIAIGPIIYFYLNYRLFQDPLHFLVVQKEHWGHYNFASPVKNFIDTVKSITWLSRSDWFILVQMQILFTVFTFVVTIVAFFKTRLSYAVYSLLSLILMTTPSFWMSNPRYVVVIFPIFIVIAILSKNRIFYSVAIGVSIALLAVFSLIYLNGPFAF